MSRKLIALTVVRVALLAGLVVSIATTQSVLAESGGCSGGNCSGSCGAGGPTNCCAMTDTCDCYQLTSAGC